MPAGTQPILAFDRDAWVIGATYWPDPDIAVKVDYVIARNQSTVVRAHAAERDELPGVRGGRRDHRVVGRRVAVRLVHREDDGARAGRAERVEQLRERLLVAVGIVAPDVRVRVIEGERARVLDDPLQPGPHCLVDR